MIRARSILIAVLTAIAGWVALVSADAGDVGELSGGSLTGPFIGSAYLAAVVLFGGSVLAPFRDKASMLLTAIGWLLALPWASWLLFPGAWCAHGACAIEHPHFVPDLHAFALALLPPLAIAMRRFPR